MNSSNMLFFVGAAVLCIIQVNAKIQYTCPKPTIPSSVENLPTDWTIWGEPCMGNLRKQIEMELTAAMTYMEMATHFSHDVINRPGFAALFFKSASEEREHAIKIIDYLLMRGDPLNTNIDKLLVNRPQSENEIPADFNGLSALKGALELETKVTKSIRSIIKSCEDDAKENKKEKSKEKEPKESYNDYHLVDYLTGEFLDEQYKGQRELAGYASTLAKMELSHGHIGEFLFDKKLLSGEI